MNNLTKASDPSMNPSEQTENEPPPEPTQLSDGSRDSEERKVRPPPNSYAAIYWPWPEDFDGFEEFVKKSREESSNRREPPPWW